MGSSYFGMPNMGSEKSSSSSSSSRRSKKSSLDKPKQPQRGLGVAQLEQIRLRTQLGCTTFPPPSFIHGPTNSTLVQEDMRMQGAPSYAVQQSSTSYPYSQSLPSTSSPYGHQPNFMMVFGDERPNLRYQDSEASVARWNPNNTSVLDSSKYAQGSMASRHLFSQFEESRQRIDHSLRSKGSSSQNSGSSDHEEVDLELRLSI